LLLHNYTDFIHFFVKFFYNYNKNIRKINMKQTIIAKILFFHAIIVRLFKKLKLLTNN
ncbi:hypothetical protein HMPREF9515_00682, partial [Enterococcus faecalis TX0860]